MCRIDLTDEGNNHIQEVIAVIFKYLSLLRAENGVDEDIWNEMHSLSQLRFNYRDKPNPYDYVSLISHGMNIFELENLLESCYAVALKFDAEKIRKVCFVAIELGILLMISMLNGTGTNLYRCWTFKFKISN